MNCDLHKDQNIELKGKGYDGKIAYTDYWCPLCKEHKHIEIK